MRVQVLGPLGHAKLGGSYMPRVEAAFPEKAQLRVQACTSYIGSYLTWDHEPMNNLQCPAAMRWGPLRHNHVEAACPAKAKMSATGSDSALDLACSSNAGVWCLNRTRWAA